MSLFDYPRINFKGTIELNPGTANNDDFAQQPGALLIPSSFPKPYAGQVFGLVDSKKVQARTFGMSDADFIAWVQKSQTFDVSGGGQQAQIPAEWNYYGDMTSKIVQAKVVGVQTGPGKVYAKADPGVAATALIGAAVSYSGHITDINSEGSPPATQFFIDSLTLTSGGKTLLSGKASKGASQWLNFMRNVNLVQDGGSGAYVYHVMRMSDGAKIDLPGFDDSNIAGVICRYYLYRRTGGVSSDEEIEARYRNHENNPAQLEIAGTFAPLFRHEKIFTGPVGRLLISTSANIAAVDPVTKQPLTNNNGQGQIALAPAVMQRSKDSISADFSGTFPDYYHSDTDNPKFDFGAVTLVVSNAGGSAPIGPVTYADTDAGDSSGWIFDFDISSNAAARQVLQDPAAKFSLQHAQFGTVLDETDYYFVSNQQAIYGEQQNGLCDRFLNQGTAEQATVAVYHRGSELDADACPPITVWGYQSTPLQCPGKVQTISTNFSPGQALEVDVSQPGNWLFTFTIEPRPPGFPPSDYNPFLAPHLTVTYAPAISLRILPNDEDFSKYYVDPNAKDKDKVGNAYLTFAVVYEKVLRTYYLLYPIMNLKAFPLNSESAVKANAQQIIQATSLDQWMSGAYMPRTRDLSASRRTLLQAWCRKVSPPSA